MQLINPRQQRSRAFSLLVVFAIVTVAFLILLGVMGWISSSSSLTARRGEYYTSLQAAESATEKVIATMTRDFLGASERSDFQGADLTTVDGNVTTYQGQYPSGTDLSGVANYEFSGPSIGTDATYVSRFADWGWTNLNWKYANDYGYAATYRVVSNARNTDSDNNIISALKQDIQLASIPVFEFAIFYGTGMDMEFHPGTSAFIVNGPVHCNGTIYCKPITSITYQDDVTASESIKHDSSPDEPAIGSLGTIVYEKEKDAGVSPLNLSIGVPNTSSNLHQIIDVPAGSPTSPLGQQQYYNKADLIILVTNNGVIFQRGISGIPSPPSALTNFLSTNSFLRVETNKTLFWNLRENHYVQFTEIDLSSSAVNPFISGPVLSGYIPTNIYVADLRASPTNEPGVRLINGANLSSFTAGGLTIATCDPLYVKGNFNNTVSPIPASLVGDAITVLSGNWNDANSANVSLAARPATDTTINAGVLAGIVPSSGGATSSGGVENFFRFLEGWSGHTFTFKGSIVVLFPSQFANSPWSIGSIYSIPNRQFSYDVNFKDCTKLPPGTPFVRTVIRDQRVATQPNSTL